MQAQAEAHDPISDAWGSNDGLDLVVSWVIGVPPVIIHFKWDVLYKPSIFGFTPIYGYGHLHLSAGMDSIGISSGVYLGLKGIL